MLSTAGSNAESDLRKRRRKQWNMSAMSKQAPGEDDSPLRGSPCGPLLTQRSLASLESLESNLLPPEVLILFRLQIQKTLLVEQGF